MLRLCCESLFLAGAALTGYALYLLDWRWPLLAGGVCLSLVGWLCYPRPPRKE